jgi:hydrogenase 3 maturation protease
MIILFYTGIIRYAFKNFFATMEKIKNHLAGRVVIMGMGDTMKGDDGAGCLFAETFGKKGPFKNFKIINAELAPENFMGVIENFSPDNIILVDAVDFKAAPGKIRLFSAQEITDTTASTHNFSLSVMLDFLKKEINKEGVIIGIQPKNLEFSEKISAEVREAVNRTVEYIIKHIRNG